MTPPTDIQAPDDNAAGVAPDATVDHFPATCGGCGAALNETMAAHHTARQVFDLTEHQPLVVTEHRAHQYQFIACGARTRAVFPEGVNTPVQYGARIAAFVVYLPHDKLLPEKRLAELIADLLGVNLVTATIAGMSQTCAARFAGFAGVVRDHVAAGRNRQHIASTILLTFYRISPKRGNLPQNVAGIVVHDHWKPYYILKGVLHALCNAHHLRELKALVEIEKGDWARRMQILFRRACHAANLAREQNRPLPPRLIALSERCYEAILAEGFAFHDAQAALVGTIDRDRRRGRKPRRVGHNLLGHRSAMQARARGGVGLVASGSVRDATALRRDRLPVFCRGVSPRAPQKNAPGSINVPIHVGGIVMSPGDMVMGDDDGVVVVPLGAAAAVPERALARERLE